MTVDAQFKSQAQELAQNTNATVTFEIEGHTISMSANDYAAYVHEANFGDRDDARLALGYHVLAGRAPV